MSSGSFKSDPPIVQLAAIAALRKSVDQFINRIETPIFLREAGMQRFRFKSPDALTLQILRAVRIVSGLNACMVLCRYCFFQEIGVVLRTVDEFLDHIDYLHEVRSTGTLTVDQQRFINEFFTKDMVPIEERMKQTKGDWQLPQKNVRASQGRSAAVVTGDSHSVQQKEKVIDEGLSAYVHGAYPKIMEMYEGGKDAELFHMEGMRDCPIAPAWRMQIDIYIHRSQIAFELIALSSKWIDVQQEIEKSKRVFEQAIGWPTVEPTPPPSFS